MSTTDAVPGLPGTVDAPEIYEPNIVAPPPPEWLPKPPPRRWVWRSPQRHWSARLLAAPVVVGALVWPLLLAGGVDAAQAWRLTFVLAVQVLGGALLWRLARGAVAVHLVELVGMGLALGSLLTLLSQQVLRVTPLGGAAWWLPAALAVLATVVLFAVPATRRRLRLGADAPLTVDEVGGVGLGVAAGFLSIWVFWRAHPLTWKGWWSYYVDIPYHEALATSVTRWGAGDNILAAGTPIRYHWFADAWAGTTTQAASAGSFVVVTRVLPLIALLGIVCLVWAWARRLTESRAAPLLAVVLTTVAMNVASATPIEFQHLLTVSPSLAMGAVWLLAASLTFTEHVRGRLRWSLVLLALLAVGCVGGKSSNLPALVGGVGLAALASLFVRGMRARVWSAFAVVALASGAAFVVVLLGSDGNLTIETGQSARILGMLPGTTWLGTVGGITAVVLVLATKWTGLAVLAARRTTLGRPEVWFGIGAALAGLVLVGGLAHPGASQFYFPVSSGIVVSVVSAWGLSVGLRRVGSGALTAAVVVGVVAGAASVALGTAGAATARAPEASPLEPTVDAVPLAHPAKAVAALPHGFLWIAPYAVWALPVLLVVVAGVRALLRRNRFPRGGLVTLLACSVVTASVVTGVFSIVDSARAPGPAHAAPNSGLAWSDMQRDALLWLRDHSAPDDVVATNRQCSGTELPGRRCASTQRWFLTAALTGRRMYVEGADYANAQPHPDWIDRRVAVSRRFVDLPDHALARVLWRAGVRWVVVDLSSTHTRSWAPYAQQMYSTPTTVVLRLDRP